VPVWSALTEGLLQEWVPPPEVRTVLIFGDNDLSFAGQTAAYTLAKRLKARGLAPHVELPIRPGPDWNVHVEKRR
jgi:putative DNA primase/helicase